MGILFLDVNLWEVRFEGRLAPEPANPDEWGFGENNDHETQAKYLIELRPYSYDSAKTSS
jgi:hypothetical protein